MWIPTSSKVPTISTILSCISDLCFPSLSNGEESENIRRRCLWSKHLRRTIIGSSGIAIDAVGQIVLGCPPLALERFKLGTMTEFLTLVSASSGWMFQFGDPYKDKEAPRSAPNFRKGGVVPATISRSSATTLALGWIVRSQPTKTPSANRPFRRKQQSRLDHISI